jgi:16S rRNA (cytidine1402-2'-O)-methyltransferase
LADLAKLDVPLVLFESPYRVLKLLDEVEEVLGDRELFVARELTKHFEECLRGRPAAVREAFSGRTLKGEFVVLIDRAGDRNRQ